MGVTLDTILAVGVGEGVEVGVDEGEMVAVGLGVELR